jgi:hypothetical protein
VVVAELPWAAAGWRARADAWASGECERLGLTLSGPVEEVKIRPWSAVLRVPAAGGDAYFKANLPVLANEPALTRVLARIDPEGVLPVLAERAAEGWMLQADGGPTMRSRLGGGDDLRRWERMLALYAELQVRVAPHAGALLAAGAPDRRPARLGGELERLLDAERDLPRSDEALAAEERARLRDLRPAFEDMCAELAALGVADSVDHSDLHSGNVLAPGDRYVFFDWHEAAVTHPFFSMVVAMRSLAHHHGVDPGGAEAGRLRDAYLDAWAGAAPRAALRSGLDLALRAGCITRALGWLRVADGLPPAERAEWAGSVSGWLRELLAALEDA